MKLMNPETFIGKGNTAPPNKLYFVVSSEMTRFDIKNYLEKIYQVPVANVPTVAPPHAAHRLTQVRSLSVRSRKLFSYRVELLLAAII